MTIHVADPIAFFEPLDARNERLEELLANPDWWFGDRDRFPSLRRDRRGVRGARRAAQRRTFIGAHVLALAEDLAWVGRMLDTYPNLHADMAARIAELGRQPRATRELIVRHPDRILFGTDLSRPAARCTRCISGSSRPQTSTSRTTPTQTKCQVRAVGRSAESSAVARARGKLRGKREAPSRSLRDTRSLRSLGQCHARAIDPFPPPVVG